MTVEWLELLDESQRLPFKKQSGRLCLTDYKMESPIEMIPRGRLFYIAA